MKTTLTTYYLILMAGITLLNIVDAKSFTKKHVYSLQDIRDSLTFFSHSRSFLLLKHKWCPFTNEAA